MSEFPASLVWGASVFATHCADNMYIKREYEGNLNPSINGYRYLIANTFPKQLNKDSHAIFDKYVNGGWQAINPIGPDRLSIAAYIPCNIDVIRWVLKYRPTIVSENDIAQGIAIREKAKLIGMCAMLSDGNIFDMKTCEVADLDVIDIDAGGSTLGVIASIPFSYLRKEKREREDQHLNEARNASTPYPAAIGQQVSGKMEVLKCFYSEKWDSYLTNVCYNKQHVMFFFGKNNLTVGSEVTLKGNIKRFDDNTTGLTRVKVSE